MTETKPKKLPFLESICWQIADVYKLTQEEMLSSYERGWRYRVGSIVEQARCLLN
ncbi:hypothetical protein [Brunnivagina elsteri]|uniref:hypothetical protein n=1 Tax=Brunnivagina elsteri TaxID=1247191 RepID=UPI0014748239|nr:hypothetical protein [Calothrix elsteri]